MGTYTANYQLYMPSIGEQGWGDLMNGNLTTIDTTMKGLNTRMGTAETNITSLTTRMGTAETTITSNKSRIGTLETETDAFDSRIEDVEKFITKLNNAVCTYSTSEPYTDCNISLLIFPTEIPYGGIKSTTLTIPKCKTNVTTPWSSYSVTAPTISVPFTISVSESGCNVSVSYDGTNVVSSVNCNTTNPVSFTLNIDTTTTHELTITSSVYFNSRPLTLTPSFKGLYLKV